MSHSSPPPFPEPANSKRPTRPAPPPSPTSSDPTLVMDVPNVTIPRAGNVPADLEQTDPHWPIPSPESDEPPAS